MGKGELRLSGQINQKGRFQGEYLQLLLIGLPILIVLVAALTDLVVRPDLVGGGLPVGGVSLALLAHRVMKTRFLKLIKFLKPILMSGNRFRLQVSVR